MFYIFHLFMEFTIMYKDLLDIFSCQMAPRLVVYMVGIQRMSHLCLILCYQSRFLGCSFFRPRKLSHSLSIFDMFHFIVAFLYHRIIPLRKTFHHLILFHMVSNFRIHHLSLILTALGKCLKCITNDLLKPLSNRDNRRIMLKIQESIDL